MKVVAVKFTFREKVGFGMS